jgi:hypothetical protein
MNIQRTLLSASIVSAALTVASAALAGVSTESPFAPRGLLANAANNSPIELRGITSDEQGMRFAIYDPVKKDGAWVRLDEMGQPYVIRSYDAATNRVIVDYQGRTQTLALAEPKFGPAPRAVPVAIPGQVQAQQGGAPVTREEWRARREAQTQQQGQGQQQQAQSSQAENARLEAIRAEIARRRGGRGSGGQ